MKLSTLLGHLGEALDTGAATDSRSLVALVRDTGLPLDSEDAWRELPIVCLEVDDGDINVLTGEAAGSSMTVAELLSWVATVVPESAEFELFLPEEWEPVKDDWDVRRFVPVISSVNNSELKLFGLMPWYEGHESELPGFA